MNKNDDLVVISVISYYIGGMMVYPPRNQWSIGAIAGGLSLIPCPPTNLPGLRPRSFQASKSSDQQAAASPSKPCVIQNTRLFLDVFYLHRDVYTNDIKWPHFIYIYILYIIVLLTFINLLHPPTIFAWKYISHHFPLKGTKRLCIARFRDELLSAHHFKHQLSYDLEVALICKKT